MARTRQDLNQLLTDLPGAELTQTRDVLELANIADDLRRHGAWTVPALTVDVDLGAGNLDIRLPKGASADLEGARTRVGTVVDTTEKSFERGEPHVVVRGGTTIGNIRVR